jgi:glycosyltransferase involved in cell wall biosynthesis
LTRIPRHSIVIPAYNESERLGPTLDRVLAFVRQQMHSAEIVVVNDGSTDQTAAIVRNHRERSEGSSGCSKIPRIGERDTAYETEFSIQLGTSSYSPTPTFRRQSRRP